MNKMLSWFSKQATGVAPSRARQCAPPWKCQKVLEQSEHSKQVSVEQVGGLCEMELPRG